MSLFDPNAKAGSSAPMTENSAWRIASSSAAQIALQDKAPVLWSTSRRSGALFQGPLYTALSLDGRVHAVTSPLSPIRDAINRDGNLLGSPVAITGAGSALAFPFRCWIDRSRLREALGKHASLVHVTMPAPWDVFYLQAARDAGVPIIVTVHDASRHPGEESRILARLDRSIMAMADHLVCLSRHVFDALSQRSDIDRPIHLLEGGLLTRADPQIEPRLAANDRPPRLLLLGRIHPYKGLDLLLDALEQLKARGAEFVLVVAGGGDIGPYADGLSRLRHVELVNRWIADEEIREILAQADVMVMPYTEASQSGVAIDALWAALPTVATPVGALPMQFDHGRDAIISDDVSASAFADALGRLLGDRQLYRTLSEGAFKSFQEIGVRRVASKWRALYAEVAK
jgi:glycosyltransferase involved in cell wall biosynthesis